MNKEKGTIPSLRFAHFSKVSKRLESGIHVEEASFGALSVFATPPMRFVYFC